MFCSTLGAAPSAPIFPVTRDRECAPHRIVLCFASPLIAEALQAVIERHTGCAVIARTTSIEQAVSAELNPGVSALIFDSSSDTPGGIVRRIERMRTQLPATALILFTANTGAAFLEAAVSTAVDGCLLQADARGCLLAALNAPPGCQYLSPSVQKRVTARRQSLARQSIGRLATVPA